MYWARLANAYYVTNGVVCVLYPLLRLTVLENNVPASLPLPFSLSASREAHIFGTVAVILAFKLVKCSTVEEFLSHLFLYMKLSSVLMLFMLHKVGFAWYIVLLVLIWMLCKRPLYSGPHKFVDIDSMTEFEQHVLSAPGSFCVLFYAQWHDACLSTMPIWAEFSLKYSTDLLHFIRVNVDTAALITKKCVVDSSGLSRQLPGLIIYESGREVCRFPPINESGNIPKVVKYRAKEISDYLGLERRWLASKAQ